MSPNMTVSADINIIEQEEDVRICFANEKYSNGGAGDV